MSPGMEAPNEASLATNSVQVECDSGTVGKQAAPAAKVQSGSMWHDGVKVTASAPRLALSLCQV
jgi:hypothetical protein